MPQLGQFTASVAVDGSKCPEYAVEYSGDGTQATCWIASQAGKKFSVSWTSQNVPFAQCGSLSVDGTTPSAAMIFGPGDINTTIDSIDTSPTTRRPLIFSQIELTDDDSYLCAPTPEIGDIKLELTEVIIHSTQHAATATYWNIPEPPQKIHERSKKGFTHRVNFGEETPQPRFNTVSTRRIRHIGTFIFKYRPMANLQATGIAPPPVGRRRVQAAVPHDVIDLTNDHEPKEDVTKQIQELETQLERLRRTQESIKSEVKTEPRNMFQPGEVIDLT